MGYKDSTVQLIINNNESVVKVAEDLNLNPKTLYLWVTTYKKAHNIPTRSLNILSSTETLDEENKRLRRENKLLKQERDILYPKGRLRAKRQQRTSQL
ncbi:transposase [Sulfurimonas sp.]|uniref:transposase n=1 Tax=Sulfurimonas sp. TaxID=2022749 RepID=UPI003A7F2EB3